MLLRQPVKSFVEEFRQEISNIEENDSITILLRMTSALDYQKLENLLMIFKDSIVPTEECLQPFFDIFKQRKEALAKTNALLHVKTKASTAYYRLALKLHKLTNTPVYDILFSPEIKSEQYYSSVHGANLSHFEFHQFVFTDDGKAIIDVYQTLIDYETQYLTEKGNNPNHFIYSRALNRYLSLTEEQLIKCHSDESQRYVGAIVSQSAAGIEEARKKFKEAIFKREGYEVKATYGDLGDQRLFNYIYANLDDVYQRSQESPYNFKKLIDLLSAIPIHAKARLDHPLSGSQWYWDNFLARKMSDNKLFFKLIGIKVDNLPIADAATFNRALANLAMAEFPALLNNLPNVDNETALRALYYCVCTVYKRYRAVGDKFHSRVGVIGARLGFADDQAVKLYTIDVLIDFLLNRIPIPIPSTNAESVSADLMGYTQCDFKLNQLKEYLAKRSLVDPKINDNNLEGGWKTRGPLFSGSIGMIVNQLKKDYALINMSQLAIAAENLGSADVVVYARIR